MVSDSGANIISVNHNREDKDSDVGACIVTMVLETRDSRHAEALQLELQSKGGILLIVCRTVLRMFRLSSCYG